MLVYAVTHIAANPWVHILVIPSIFVGILYGIAFFCIRSGSDFARGFLSKMALVHSGGIFLLFVFFAILSLVVTRSSQFALLLFPIFVAAFFEEATKHLTTLGLLSRNFRFSLRDLSFFSVFIVLGFVFFENVFYVFGAGISPMTLVFRSFFALSAHLLAVMICTYFWWKALSYPFFSPRYLLYFFVGFLLAISSHALYNYALAANF